MCADDDSFRSVWSKARDHVAIGLVLNTISLFGNGTARLREFAGNVRGCAIEIFRVSDISRRKVNREFTHVCFKARGIDRAHGMGCARESSGWVNQNHTATSNRTIPARIHSMILIIRVRQGVVSGVENTNQVDSSATISRIARRASSTSSGLKEIAPTTA